jgi:hypothetical protein
MTRPLKPAELARRKEKRAKARDEKKISQAVEATKKHGGFRPGAGRKPDWLKRASMPPRSARELLLDYETKKLWAPLVTASDLELRFLVLSYLQNCIFGQPKSVSELSATVRQYEHMTDAELEAQLNEDLARLGYVKPQDVSTPPALPAPVPTVEASKEPAPLPYSQGTPW